MNPEAGMHGSLGSNSDSSRTGTPPNDLRKGNLGEDLILHASKLLPALKIECFYWLTAQQSESFRRKPTSAPFKHTSQLFHVHTCFNLC